VRDGLEAWESPELVIVTAPRWFDIEGDFPPNVIHAGPLGVRVGGREGRADRPRALLSFSTTVMHGQPGLVQRACDALAALDVDGVLTLGPALDAAGVRVPDNVTVVPFADHDELLSSCAAVVGHGGLGTTLRALAHGVPLLLMPLGRDQVLTAGRVAQLGMGVRLELQAPSATIARSLKRLLADARYATAAAAAATRIRDAQPDRSAVSALERVAIAAG